MALLYIMEHAKLVRGRSHCMYLFTKDPQMEFAV